MIRKKLREARERAGLTQQELADIVGIDRASYSNIELGKRNPSLEVAIKISKVLGKDVNDIFLINRVSERNNIVNDEKETTEIA